jgi:hypothetical protein
MLRGNYEAHASVATAPLYYMIPVEFHKLRKFNIDIRNMCFVL